MEQNPEPRSGAVPDDGAPTGPTPDAAHFHVQEAIRHLHAAVDSESCGVCAGLFEEEIAHLEMTDALMGQVQDLVRAQAEKRAQLSTAEERADGLPPEFTREYVEERIHTGPGGRTHSEVVRGVETEPKRRETPGILGMARSFVKDRPRLTDMLSAGSRR